MDENGNIAFHEWKTGYLQDHFAYNPTQRRNIRRPELRLRDQHATQTEGTDKAWPNP